MGFRMQGFKAHRYFHDRVDKVYQAFSFQSFVLVAQNRIYYWIYHDDLAYPAFAQVPMSSVYRSISMPQI